MKHKKLTAGILQSWGLRILANFPITIFMGVVVAAIAYFFWWLIYRIGWDGYWFQLEIWMANNPAKLENAYIVGAIALTSLVATIVITSNNAAKHLYHLDDLDYKIWTHQRSTRTLIPAFVPMHEWLSLRFTSYRQWHSHRLARELHLYIVLLFAGTMGFLLFKSTSVPLAEASHGCADTVSITGNTTWSTNQCHGDVTITNGATLTIAGNTTHQLTSLTLGDGATNGFITAQGDTVNGIGVTITTDGNVEVKSGSSISANGQGYTSGNGPGAGGSCGGAGTCPGAYGGMAAQGTGVPYGSATAPVSLGSGGTNTAGGAIKITVGGNFTNSGSITASPTTGSGSGGSIWINMTGGSSTWAGTSGTIAANGGTGVACCGGGGGGGRVAVTGYVSDTHTGTTSAYGGTGPGGNAASGTVYTKSSSQTYGTLTLDNNNSTASGGKYAHPTVGSATFDSLVLQNRGVLQLPSGASITIAASGTLTGTSTNAIDILSGGTFDVSNITAVGGAPITNNSGGTFTAGSAMTLSTTLVQRGTFTTTTTDLTVASGGTLTADVAMTFDDITVQSGGNITHTANTTSETYKVNITATNITINSGGTVNVNNKGYAVGEGPGEGGSCGGQGDCAGAHGGMAGASAGNPYGSLTAPVNIGSGGRTSGGGAVKFTISGNFANSGSITANDSASTTSNGSGGSVWINLTGGSSAWSGNGSIAAEGGSYTFGCCSGGGGGGRVAVTGFVSDSHSGATTAYGGTGYSSINGSAGTVYTKSSSQTYGTLTIDNTSRTPDSGKYAKLNDGSSFSITLDSLVVQNRGALQLPSGISITIASSGSMSGNTNGTIDIASGGTLNTANITTVTGPTITNNSGGILTPNSNWTLSTTLIQRGTIGTASSNLTIASGGNLTADVAITFGNLTVQSGGDIDHTDNTTAETYKINLSMANLTIDSGGTVTADSVGYDLGYGPGHPSSGTSGAAYGGMGAGGGSNTYGSVTAPENIGSGGGSSPGTSSGGGAIKFTVSGNFSNSGTVSANAATGGCGPNGSGGSVYILMTGGSSAWSGTSGTIRANGGTACSGSHLSGGGGRVAIVGYVSDTHTGTTSAYAGTINGAAAGTVYTKSTAQTNGTLTIDNNNVAVSGGLYAKINTTALTLDSLVVQNQGKFQIVSGETLTMAASSSISGSANGYIDIASGGTLNTANITAVGTSGSPPITNNSGGTFTPNSTWTLATSLLQRGTIGTANSNLTIASGGNLTADVAMTFGNVVVQSGGDIDHTDNSTAETYKIDVSVTDLTINSGGTVTADGLGFDGANGPGAPSSGSASHGGMGFGGTGAIYGSVTQPVAMGSGGQFSSDHSGGGIIKLTVSGNFSNSGTISANAATGGCARGGSGGSVWINMTGGGTWGGTSGTIRANGTTPCSGSYSSGGGGRIAVVGYAADSHTGTTSAYGGTLNAAAAGTVYTKSTAQTYGTLLVDNSNTTTSGVYTRTGISSITFDVVTVQNRGYLHIPTATTITATTKTVATNSTLWNQGTLNGDTDSITGTYIADGTNALGDVTVNSGGVITHSDNSTAETTRMVITATSMTVSAGGVIEANGLGFDGGAAGANGAGSTTGRGALGGATSAGGGGGYGGIGGTGGGANGGAGGATYGSQTAPTNLGSGAGGGVSAGGGSGGGAIQITTTGNLTVTGTIRANGAAGSAGTYGGGGGSGGSIYLIVGGNLNCTSGTITANGGNGAGTTQVGGGGGGGRIARNVSGTYTACATLTVSAGTGGTGAAAGTNYSYVSAPTISAASNITSTSVQWNWTDASTTETTFRVQNPSHAEIANVASTTTAGTGTGYSHSETGLTPNTSYTRHVHGHDGTAEGSASADSTAVTLANVPGTITVASPTTTTLGLTLDVNSNPGSTELAIYESVSGKYVQADGTLGTGATWQTNATWGTVTVTGLSVNTQYTFAAKARNSNNTETALSTSASKYTLASTPLAPTLSNPTPTSMVAIINVGTNPTTGTTFSLKETTSGQFVQANGALGSTEVKQTYAQWGGVTGTTVTGLTASTIYTFVTYAHNGDGVATAASNSTSLSTAASPISDTGTGGSGGDSGGTDESSGGNGTSDDSTEDKPKKKGDSGNTGGNSGNNSGGTTTPGGDDAGDQPGSGNGSGGNLETCDQSNFFDLLFGWLGGRNKSDSPCVPADPPADPPCFLWCTVTLRVQITPPGGTFTDTTKATLSHTPSSEPADIYFTIDGSEPSQYSILYRRPLYISEDLTIKARAYSPASETAIAQFIIKANDTSSLNNITVTATPAGGIYSQPVTVTLSSSDPESTIYYTTDGSSPLTKRLPYLGPLTLSQSAALTFYAESADGTASAVVREQYIITSVHVPVTLEWEPITEETTDPLSYEVKCNNEVIAATPLNSYLDTRTRPDGCTYAVFAVADGERKPVTISGISAEPRILETLDQGPILTVLKSGWTYWGLILGALIGLAGSIKLFFQWLWYLLRLALLLPPYWWGKHKKPNIHGVIRKAGIGEALPYVIVSLTHEKYGKDVGLGSKEGIFGFAARAGQYTIQVFKPGFEISKDVRVGNYHGEVLALPPGQEIERIIVCFPTIFKDPKTIREARLMLLSLAFRFSILFFGLLLSVLLFLHAATIWNAAVAVLYIISWLVTFRSLRRNSVLNSKSSNPAVTS